MTRLKATPPSAAPAGTAATPVNTATAPPATTALPIVFFTCDPSLSPAQPGPGAWVRRPEAFPHG
ncbi:hypothetical protein GCM10010253_12410 [Streptomyces badius]|uniref:Uncharacterized protein n=1 Tax=Streptomyces badius TaxID=1941 RepID=A0ABQ2STW7_STRBA|nr:hypothetical protein GCM10010253_12410 [Streptomyces badius]